MSSTTRRKKYLKALLLSEQNGLHTLINLIRGSIRVGNLISSADLLLKTLLELGLSLLVLLDLLSQVTAGDIDLSLNARVAGSWGLLDLFQEVAEVAECVVDVILNVVEVLASSLVFLARAGIEELVLRLRKSGFSLCSEFPETIVDFGALVQNAGSVVCLAQFCRHAVSYGYQRLLAGRTHHSRRFRTRHRGNAEIEWGSLAMAEGGHKDWPAGCRDRIGRSHRPVGCRSSDHW